jgi:hypothetical protein
MLHITYYILSLMTIIVPDDEEFANRWKRNRCEYRKKGVCVSLGAFSSSCLVMGHAERIRRNEETEILLNEKTKTKEKKKNVQKL